MQALEQELKQVIIDALDLEDITPADIASDAPLFVEGLGLDSIDALELGLAIHKTYGVTIESDTEENRRHFASVTALAAFVAQAQGHQP
jgi:acyl carrier protein